jgi:anaerobic ribonucleoside-triphosphate reductase activating protein
MDLRYFRRDFQTSALGPGNRTVIWVQGCSHKCAGCIVPESWDTDAGDVISVQEMARWVLAQSGIEGITLSGGEPFQQAEALCLLVDLVKRNKDLGVMCYTGYTLERLTKHGTIAQKEFLRKIDLLVDGLYLQNFHGDLLWRGSSNQRLILLTERYRQEIADLPDRSVPLEFSLSQDLEVSFTGIPNRVGFREDFEAEMLRGGVVIKPQMNDIPN